MCVDGCGETVRRNLSRRDVVGGLTMVAAGAAVFQALPVLAADAAPRSRRIRLRRVVDLTHTHSPTFPTWSGVPGLRLEQRQTLAKDGFNLFYWHLDEHTGTHLDAPLHFSDGGAAVDAIPVERLVVPLVVVDVRAKTDVDPDYRLSLEDLVLWERVNGRIPRGACVAMNSGWAAHVATPKFRNAGADGVMHFPGFDARAAEFLARDRGAVGLAVDTLSLDRGMSKNFPVHTLWLPSGRFGLECVAGLADVPVRGATLVVGMPKIAGASGGPCRLMALV